MARKHGERPEKTAMWSGAERRRTNAGRGFHAQHLCVRLFFALLLGHTPRVGGSPARNPAPRKTSTSNAKNIFRFVRLPTLALLEEQAATHPSPFWLCAPRGRAPRPLRGCGQWRLSRWDRRGGWEAPSGRAQTGSVAACGCVRLTVAAFLKHHDDSSPFPRCPLHTTTTTASTRRDSSVPAAWTYTHTHKGMGFLVECVWGGLVGREVGAPPHCCSTRRRPFLVYECAWTPPPPPFLSQ